MLKEPSEEVRYCATSSRAELSSASARAARAVDRPTPISCIWLLMGRSLLESEDPAVNLRLMYTREQISSDVMDLCVAMALDMFGERTKDHGFVLSEDTR